MRSFPLLSLLSRPDTNTHLPSPEHIYPNRPRELRRRLLKRHTQRVHPTPPPHHPLHRPNRLHKRPTRGRHRSVLLHAIHTSAQERGQIVTGELGGKEGDFSGEGVGEVAVYTCGVSGGDGGGGGVCVLEVLL